MFNVIGFRSFKSRVGAATGIGSRYLCIPFPLSVRRDSGRLRKRVGFFRTAMEKINEKNTRTGIHR